MTKINLPENIEVKPLKGNHYQVTIEPCHPGYAVILGNTLRRVLLSSLTGAAVTSFKVEGAQHEFDSVEHIKEDLVEIMLNLKQLRVRLHSDEPVKLKLSAKGEKEVTAGDISKNSAVDVLNKDLVIATLTDKQAKLEMEITVENGIGYVTVEQRETGVKPEIGHILVDSSYSPVLSVGYNIESVRVGEMTNFEKLTMDILTDGGIDGQEAVSQAATIIRDHFGLLVAEPAVVPEKKTRKSKKEKEDEPEVEIVKEDAEE